MDDEKDLWEKEGGRGADEGERPSGLVEFYAALKRAYLKNPDHPGLRAAHKVWGGLLPLATSKD